jgi:hypothetical protein
VKAGDWIAIVALVPAIVALLLASVNTYVQWQQHKDKQRRRLGVQGVIRTRPATRPGEPPQEERLDIMVTNLSQIAITVGKIFSRVEPVQYHRVYPREQVRGEHPLPEKPLPHTLAPATMAIFWLPWEKVYGVSPDEDGRVRFIIGVVDEKNTVYEHTVEYRKGFDARPR